jgi:hypothetical protein
MPPGLKGEKRLADVIGNAMHVCSSPWAGQRRRRRRTRRRKGLPRPWVGTAAQRVQRKLTPDQRPEIPRDAASSPRPKEKTFL